MRDELAIPYGYNADTGKFARYLDNRHLITFGPTRSGKGATVIVQALLQVPHSVICIDPKGQNAAITARRRRELGQDVYFLNPFDELSLGTSRFNPLAHLSIDDPNVVADASSLAEALILSEGKDPHWSDSARTLVRVLILYLIATRGGNATLIDVRRLLTQPRGEAKDGSDDAFRALVFQMLESGYEFIAQPAAQFQAVTREVESIISTARTQTAFLDDPVIAHVLGGSDFSMTALKDAPTTVFLILPGRYIEAYARFFRLLVTSAVDQLTVRPGGHRTLFVLDEFATLQSLGAISKAFGFAAGYNVQLWPFLQDLPQLKAIYDDKWESFLANAGLVQFFTPSDMTTAEYLERRGGKVTEARHGISKGEISVQQARQGYSGVTESVQESETPLLRTELTMEMHRDKQIVFFAGVHGPQVIGRVPYWQIPRLTGLFDPDPFHEGSFEDMANDRSKAADDFLEELSASLRTSAPPPRRSVGKRLGQAFRQLLNLRPRSRRDIRR